MSNLLMLLPGLWEDEIRPFQAVLGSLRLMIEQMASPHHVTIALAGMLPLEQKSPASKLLMTGDTQHSHKQSAKPWTF